jgi:hypothetical protein
MAEQYGTADQMTQLLAGLAEGQRIARNVEKTSLNPFHRYHYAGTEAMILEAKETMGAVGLALIPRGARMFSLGTRSEGDPKAPREVPQLFLAKRWSLAHKAGGLLELEEQVWPVVPEKGRPLDKAVAAADTASLGYLLRNVLMLARVEEGTDLDHPSRDEHRGRQQHDDRDPRDDGPALMSTDQRAEITRLFDVIGVPKADRGKRVAEIVGHKNNPTADDAANVIAELHAEADMAGKPQGNGKTNGAARA